MLYGADLELSLQKKKQPIVNDVPQKYQRAHCKGAGGALVNLQLVESKRPPPKGRKPPLGFFWYYTFRRKNPSRPSHSKTPQKCLTPDPGDKKTPHLIIFKQQNLKKQTKSFSNTLFDGDCAPRLTRLGGGSLAQMRHTGGGGLALTKRAGGGGGLAR